MPSLYTNHWCTNYWYGAPMPTTPETDALALENQVCFAVALAARGVIAAYRPVLEPLKLTHPQYLVMLALWEQDPLSNRELSSLLHLDPGTLSPLVKRLEQIGYVQRFRPNTDERRVEIHLTAAGRALRERAVHVPQVMIRRLGLQSEDLPALNSTMHALVAAAAQAGPVTADDEKALRG